MHGREPDDLIDGTVDANQRGQNWNLLPKQAANEKYQNPSFNGPYGTASANCIYFESTWSWKSQEITTI